ncbi:MAG: cupin domain-containing protein [Dehalococcoidia bacterium]
MTQQASPFEALLGELAESQFERDEMARALELLAYSADEAEPAPNLRDRVLARIQQPERPPVFEYRGDYFARSEALDWFPLAPGIELKFLYRDAATGAQTVLVRMAPNLAFPYHPHPDIEDLYLISGDAYVGDVLMQAGDYCRANAGTAHADVRSGPSGSLAMVVSR